MTTKHFIESLASRTDEYNKRSRRIVKLSAAISADIPEVVQLCLEAFKSWLEGKNPSKDFNLARQELKKFNVKIKSIECSVADSDTVNLITTEGVAYRITVTRFI